MNAYDIVLNQRGKDGWCGGRPPGIMPEQWCRSRESGLPMRHLFTVRVPDDYCVKGKEWVAVSVFQDVTETSVKGVANAFKQKKVAAKLLSIPFWKSVSDYIEHRHPQEVFVKDDIQNGWAWIWLTEAEFSAPMCEPPSLDRLDEHPPMSDPKYLFEPKIQKLKLVPRKGDVNAGKKLTEFPKWETALMLDKRVVSDLAKEEIEKIVAKEYVPMHSELGKKLKLERFWSHAHFGGTASPAQGEPPFSPVYLEFDETMGNANLGGDGACQIDLLNNKLSWACG
jgi:hypothetical protein